jgi:hypothetical protein
MNANLLIAAMLGSNLVIPVSDRVPELKVEALCKETAETDKAMGLALAQNVTDCMRDETDAQKQLGTLWATTKVPVRDQCEGEAVAGGSQSYVDLLICIQMAEWNSPSTQTQTQTQTQLRGASKNRNKK